MERTQGSYTFEEIAAQAGFIRRLAGLLRDADAAEDAAQEALVTAWQRPPARQPGLRGWLRSVVLNRVRMDARAGRRRGAREANTDMGEAVTTPEAMVASMQLQQRMAALVLALEEPYRQVLFLRFYEERTPSEVAALLGQPAGTVRWRLKTALDKLRAALDEGSETRERWRALALGLVGRDGANTLPAGGAGGSGHNGRARAAMPRRVWWAGLAAVGTTCFVLGVGRLERRTEGSVPARAENARALAATRASEPTSSPGQKPRENASGTCPEATALQQRIEALERDLAPRRPLAAVFASSAPNPEAEARVNAVLHAAAEKVEEACPHTVECRGQVCRFTQVQGLAPGPACVLLGRVEEVLGDTLDRRRPVSQNNELLTDPVTRQRLAKATMHLPLASPVGTPVPAARQPALPAVAVVRHQSRSTSATPDPGCRSETARLVRRVEALERQIDEALGPAQAFATSAPNPSLTASFRPRLEHILAAFGTPLALAVSCRGPFCTVLPRRAGDLAAAGLTWDCARPRPQGPCSVAPGDRSFYGSLLLGWFQREDLRALVEAPQDPPAPVARGELVPLVMWVKEPGAGTEDIIAVMRRFGEHARYHDALAACESQFRGTGTLAVIFRFARSPDGATPGGVMVQTSGPLSETALGRCILGRLEAAAATFELPSLSQDYSAPRQVRFPGAASHGPRGSGVLGDDHPFRR